MQRAELRLAIPQSFAVRVHINESPGSKTVYIFLLWLCCLCSCTLYYLARKWKRLAQSKMQVLYSMSYAVTMKEMLAVPVLNANLMLQLILLLILCNHWHLDFLLKILKLVWMQHRFSPLWQKMKVNHRIGTFIILSGIIFSCSLCNPSTASFPDLIVTRLYFFFFFFYYNKAMSLFWNHWMNIFNSFYMLSLFFSPILETSV